MCFKVKLPALVIFLERNHLRLPANRWWAQTRFHQPTPSRNTMNQMSRRCIEWCARDTRESTGQDESRADHQLTLTSTTYPRMESVFAGSSNQEHYFKMSSLDAKPMLHRGNEMRISFFHSMEHNALHGLNRDKLKGYEASNSAIWWERNILYTWRAVHPMGLSFLVSTIACPVSI